MKSLALIARTYWYVPLTALAILLIALTPIVGSNVMTTAVPEVDCYQTSQGEMQRIWNVPNRLYESVDENHDQAISQMKAKGKTPEIVECDVMVNNS